jgi:hypothetical protein
MKTRRGSLLRTWLFCSLLGAGSAGCTLYIDTGDNGSDHGPGYGGPGYGPGDGSGGDSDDGEDSRPPPATDVPGYPPAPAVPRVPLVGFDTADRGNADGIHSCSDYYEYSHYEHSSAGSTQLHVVGIYEVATPTGSTERREGKVDVRVTRPGPSVLLLSSYEPTTWNVIVEPGAYVERIVLNGFHAQSVSAPEGTPVESYAADPDTGAWLGYGYAWPSYDALGLIETAQALTGLELTSFRGCYASDGFQIDTPAEIRPPHPVSDKPGLTVPAGCEHVAEESAYCLSRSGATPAVIGLDSGTVCQNDAFASSSVFDTSSLGWRGDYAYGCIHERGLARISLIDGTVDIAPISCEAVTVDEDGSLLVMPFWGADFPDLSIFSVIRFDSFEAVAQRQITEVLPVEPWASRMAVAGGRGYFAWHSTSTIEVADLATGAIQSLPLENYDDWILGLDVVGDRLLVLGSWNDPGLRVFNATTGKQETVIASGFHGEGLACASRDL